MNNGLGEKEVKSKKKNVGLLEVDIQVFQL